MSKKFLTVKLLDTEMKLYKELKVEYEAMLDCSIISYEDKTYRFASKNSNVREVFFVELGVGSIVELCSD